MQIRRPTDAETTVVTNELLIPGLKDSEAKAPEFNELDDDGVADASCDYWLNDDDKILLVAETDDTLVAHISAGRFDSPPVYTRGPRTHIDGLYVKPAYRRQGVASALIERVEQWAAERNCEHLGITAHVDNDAATSMYDHDFDRTYLSYYRPIE
ncbi:GNAT family N-acetyltransferase [Haloferax namakaokahaiae]|uniref:GNAT family N-acetyltransferase n=1 Tax=Haloferax namakaokahaiae TaxID=1748331 RepID=A0ABD5ZH10_9EURY